MYNTYIQHYRTILWWFGHCSHPNTHNGSNVIISIIIILIINLNHIN